MYLYINNKFIDKCTFLVLRNEKMENIEAEKYNAYQQKTLEIISNKIKTVMIAEREIIKKTKKCPSSIKMYELDKLSIEELSNIIDNSPDPLEIQVINLVFF